MSRHLIIIIKIHALFSRRKLLTFVISFTGEDKGLRTSHKILYFNALGSKVHEKHEILNVKYSM